MNVDALRLMTDRVKESDPDSVTVLASASGGKVSFVAACGKNAVKRGANAGKIVRAAAVVAGGGGGGRPDSATAGGRDMSRVGDALATVEASLEAIK
jgi:alanyl-tRNA synthetase